VSEESEAKTEPGAALWNPNAAANWSLLFTPVFGAYLQALNWRALGEHKRASGSLKWVYVGGGLLAFYLLLSIFAHDDRAARGIAHLVSFGFLLAWYFSSGKAQARYVKETYGTSYPRRPLGKPLLIAVACFVAFVVVATLIGFVMDSAGGT
jgi:hypothetical protein